MEGSADSAFCNDMFHFNLLLVKRRWGLTESRSPCHFAETTKLQEVHIPRCTVRAALFQLPCQTICLLHGVKDVTTLSRMTVGGRESFFLGRTSLWWKKKTTKLPPLFGETRSSPTIHHSIPSKTQDQQNMSEFYQQQTFGKKKTGQLWEASEKPLVSHFDFLSKCGSDCFHDSNLLLDLSMSYLTDFVKEMPKKKGKTHTWMSQEASKWLVNGL